jgi:hypothetical protein
MLGQNLHELGVANHALVCTEQADVCTWAADGNVLKVKTFPTW